MSRSWAAPALFMLVSCSVALEPPADARITCGRNSACPQGYTCAESLGYCVNDGTSIPALAVAFTLPRDGDVKVALNFAGVVVLNMDAKLPEDGSVTLVSEDGLDDVPLLVSVAGAANSLVIEATDLLFPVTKYVLTVQPGIAPADGLLAAPSIATWTATFETAESSDITPPEPVTDLIVEKPAADSRAYSMRWTASSSADVAGVVAVRHSDSPVVDLPQNGRSYAVGQSVGAAVVTFVGINSFATDSAPTSSPTYYALHVFDTALNYSTQVQPPIGEIADLRWCGDRVGRFRIVSPDAGNGRLYVSQFPGAIYGGGDLVPATDLDFGAEGTFTTGAEPFIVGATVYVRPVARNGDATYVGPEQALVLSDPDLALSAAHAELNMPAKFHFKANGWPAFEAQADSNPADGAETWVAAEVNDSYVIAVFTQDGTYRVRVRPVVAGCPDAPWTTSPPFIGGTNKRLYVKAGATGAGFAPSDPAGNIAAVNGAADAATAVLVAEGVYNEPLQLTEGVEYLGGYASDFSEATRDPDVHVTELVQGSQVILVTQPLTPSTLVDGFHLTGNAVTTVQVVRFVSTGGPTLSNDTVKAPRTFWGNAGITVEIAGASPVIKNNRIDASVAVWIMNGTALLEDNVMTGSSYQRAVVYCDGGVMTLQSNTITMDAPIDQLGNSHAIEVNGCSADIIGNRIASNNTTSSLSFYSSGVNVSSGTARIFNNDIYAGAGRQAVGILLYASNVGFASSNGEVLISNNTIHAGDGDDPMLGSPRVGIAFDTRAGGLPGPTRITNNLIFGTSSFLGFVVDDSYSGLKSVENNVVMSISGGTGEFLRILSGSTPSAAMTAETAEASYCGATTPIRLADNAQVDTTLAAVFTDVDGPDNVLATPNNDWRLKSSAPAPIKTGALTLGSSTSCGGDTCAAASNASCGSFTDDLDGTARTPAWSVGSHEAP